MRMRNLVSLRMVLFADRPCRITLVLMLVLIVLMIVLLLVLLLLTLTLLQTLW